MGHAWRDHLGITQGRGYSGWSQVSVELTAFTTPCSPHKEGFHLPLSAAGSLFLLPPPPPSLASPLELKAASTTVCDSLPSTTTFAAATTMDIPFKIEELEAKIEVLEAENQDLRKPKQLSVIVNPEGRKDIRAQITANQSAITANPSAITEYLKTINATTTTSGNIHL